MCGSGELGWARRGVNNRNFDDKSSVSHILEAHERKRRRKAICNKKSERAEDKRSIGGVKIHERALNFPFLLLSFSFPQISSPVSPLPSHICHFSPPFLLPRSIFMFFFLLPIFFSPPFYHLQFLSASASIFEVLASSGRRQRLLISMQVSHTQLKRHTHHTFGG